MTAAPESRRPGAEQWILGAFMGLVLASTYLFYSLNSGITITNDGSHFALFDALVTTGSPELPHVRQFAFGDSALYEGRYYSDRNPGLALITYTTYQAMEPLQDWSAPLFLDPKMARRYLPDQSLRIPLVMLVPALSGALLLLGMYLLCRELGAGIPAAMVAASSLAFGTLLLRYSTLFYSHATSAALLVWGVYLVLHGSLRQRPASLILGIALMSTAVLVEHLLILVFAPVGIYLLLRARSLVLQPQVLMGICIAGCLPMVVLMIYNYVCFDSPFSLAHFHHSTDKANHSLTTLFRPGQMTQVLGNLFFGAPKAEVGRQDLTGLFSASPFLVLLLLPLARHVWPGDRLSAEHWILLAAFCLVAAGAASNFAPYGGWDRDYRYLVAAVPLLAPLLAVGLDQLMRSGHASTGSAGMVALRIATLLLFAGLLGRSIVFHLGHVRHAQQVQYPQPLVNLDAALVNVSLLYVVLATIGAALVCARYVLAKARQEA